MPTGLLYVFGDTSVEVFHPFVYWVVQESPLKDSALPCVEQRHVSWAAAAALQPESVLKMVMNSLYEQPPSEEIETATTPEILHVSLPDPNPSLSLEVTNILSALIHGVPNPTDVQHTYV